jgi:hypothetical protein
VAAERVQPELEPERQPSGPQVAATPALGGLATTSGALTPDAALRLQRSAGNRAVARVVGGLDPFAPEPDELDAQSEPIGGIGSVVRNLWNAARGGGARPPRPITTSAAAAGSATVGAWTAAARPVAAAATIGSATIGSGRAAAVTAPAPAPAVTPPAPPPPPAAITVTTTNVAGPTWSANGAFLWDIGFTTSGRSGWLVQEVVNTIDVHASDGSVVDTSSVIPRYWEAWAVDAAGAVTPFAPGPINDMWRRPGRGATTRGDWSMTGNVHFTTTDPATQGFRARGVSNAGILLATTTAPSGLGPVLLHRHAKGKWDSTTATPVAHTGTAGP